MALTTKDAELITLLGEHRSFETETQKNVYDERLHTGGARHIAPYSVLIACMGNHWEPGCREAVWDMYQETFKAGYLPTFYEQKDMCYEPFDAIGSMRNAAYHKAVSEGHEYLCYVDNDIQPPPDALVNLMRSHLPIVAPALRFADGETYGLASATAEGEMAAMVHSVVLSMLVFRTAIFRPLGGEFWENARGADEAYHFEKLDMLTGHRPFLFPSVQVKVIKPPHFPLDNRPAGVDLSGWVPGG